MSAAPPSAQTVRLADYRPPEWLISDVSMDISLNGDSVQVAADLSVVRNPQAHSRPNQMTLAGKGLELLSLQINGRPADYRLSEDGAELTVPCPADRFALTTISRFRPSANTDLMGLYSSGGIYCTQCEAEGFRRITWHPDRPDILSRYQVRIEAPNDCPTLLAGGNLLQTGPAEQPGRHYALWQDPHPRPSYLFALVAGKLEHIERQFTTCSGREVSLRLYGAPGKTARLHFALQALEDAMRWDEQRYGRQYDLDLFQIVAVDDFNFGAMENKGLNIFNAAALYAEPELVTDAGYRTIRAVVAHEYFHNWSGNRVTLRDWFQLCLKEGFTVFRDQSFSCDLEGRGIERIRQVRDLRQRQFREDAGPLAHPVRPSSYQKIDNFYTSTVYEKGAEVVRMLAELLGERQFRAACDLYFSDCDGKAATVEDLLHCISRISGRDLSVFKRWYTRKGTPALSVGDHWQPQTGRYSLTLTQQPPEVSPDSAEPFHIPVRLALYNAKGEKTPCRLEENDRTAQEFVLELQQRQRVFHFTGLREKPVLSILRGFSAPVLLQHAATEPELAVLARCDDDAFRRWEAVQELYSRALAELAGPQAAVAPPRLELLQALWGHLLGEQQLADEVRAALLTLPGPALAFDWSPPAPERFSDLHRRLSHLLTEPHLPLMQRQWQLRQQASAAYSADSKAMGQREMRNWLLYRLTAAEAQPDRWHRQSAQQALQADNLTDRLAGLRALLDSSCGQLPAQQALHRLKARWSPEPLLMDRWFAAQALTADEQALARVQALTAEASFSLNNPNRVRALLGTASANGKLFHRPDGAGYRWLADWIGRLDRINPSVSARLCGAFSDCSSLSPQRQAQAAQALRQLRAPGLSAQLGEQAERILSALHTENQRMPPTDPR